MWINNLTQTIAQQAADLVQEVGLEEQLAQAKTLASNVIQMQPGNDGNDSQEAINTDFEDIIQQTAKPTENSNVIIDSMDRTKANKEKDTMYLERLRAVEATAADALGELEDYKERLDVAVASRKATQKELDALHSEVETLRVKASTAATLNEELQALRQKMTKAKRQYNALKQQLAEAQEANQAAVTIIPKETSQVDAARVKELEENINMLEEQLGEQKEVMSGAFEENKALKEEREVLKQENDALKAKTTALEEQDTILQQEMSVMKAENLERQKRFAAVQVSFDSKREDMEHQLEQLQAALEVAQSRADEAEAQLAESKLMTKDHAMELGRQVEQLHAQHAADKDQLRRELNAAQEEAILKVSEEAVARVEEAEIALKEQLARAEAAHVAQKQLVERIAELEEETAQAKAAARAAAEAVAPALGAEIFDCEEETLRKKLHAAEQAATVATKRAAAAEEQIDALKTSLSEAEKKANELVWQVKMLASAGDDGQHRVSGAPTGGRLQQLGGWLDAFGCAINYNRRG